MAVFRVEKSKDYTVMSNHHLRNNALSLKAKGLLSQMLSLPEEWDFTLSGLAKINKEGVDAIRSAINELEEAGYVVRRQTTDENGRFSDNEYIIHEQPVCAEPLLDFPTTDNPSTEKPLSENPTQLNIDISSKDISSKDISKRKNKKEKGTLPEMMLEEMKPLFRQWCDRVDPGGNYPKLYALLVEWYSPRVIKRGGPPVKSMRGLNGLFNKLEQDYVTCDRMVYELNRAIEAGWSGLPPKKHTGGQPPDRSASSEKGLGDRM